MADLDVKVTESTHKRNKVDLMNASVDLLMESQLHLVIGINQTDDGGVVIDSNSNMPKEMFREALEYVLANLPK